jgi:hypothetical protein
MPLNADDLQARQDATNRRFADFAPDGILADAQLMHDLSKVPKFLNSDNVENICSGHGEMPTEIIVKLVARFLHLGIENIGDLSR